MLFRSERQNWLYVYGSDKGKILALQNEDSSLALPLHPKYEFTGSEVIWAVREEMAQTLDDVLFQLFLWPHVFSMFW